MYGLPSDIDLSFFVGRTLLQASFGANELILAFSDAVSVTIESSYRIGQPGEEAVFEDVRSSAQQIVRLIEKQVVVATSLGDGTLGLTFDDGQRLEIYEDAGPYESYQIVHGKEIIV